MKRGFYTIMSAQFLSSLADNAVLYCGAIALLRELELASWQEKPLKLTFAVWYVLLAPFVGALADAMPKARVMLITNTIKVFGCISMLWIHPYIAYGIIGLGAAAYSPAKYGILTELLPAQKLVAANGWIEGLTIASIILGTVFGGYLADAYWIRDFMISLNIPSIELRSEASLPIVAFIYALAAMFNLFIPDTGARYPNQEKNPLKLLKEFSHCVVVLWKDKLGQISLAVTTLFWGAGATLQFIILDWVKFTLKQDSISYATNLQGVAAIGTAIGAVISAARVPLRKSLNVLPMGAIMGVLAIILGLFNVDYFPQTPIAIGAFNVSPVVLAAATLIFAVGLCSGYFVVPMNALLQHRGHVLMSAGHSIAVQNFNEHVNILLMIALVMGLQFLGTPAHWVMIGFGILLASVMLLIIYWHKQNQKQFDSVSLIPDNAGH